MYKCFKHCKIEKITTLFGSFSPQIHLRSVPIWGAGNLVTILISSKSPILLFKAKIDPSFRNYVDRIGTFKIVGAYHSQKANAAADFLTHFQKDPKEVLEIKLTGFIVAREMEKDVCAKLPGNTINELFANDLPH